MPHDHSHHGSARRHQMVAIIMLSYALFEIIGWSISGNPLILADASHNLADTAFPLLSSLVIRLTARTKRHALSCYTPTLFSYGVYLVSLIILVVIELSEGSKLRFLSNSSLGIGLVLAAGSLLLNLYSMQQLERQHGAIEHASWSHFLLDAATAGGIMFGTAVQLITGYNQATYWTLIVLILAFGLVVIWQSIKLPNELHLRRPHPHQSASD